MGVEKEVKITYKHLKNCKLLGKAKMAMGNRFDNVDVLYNVLYV